MGRCTLTVRTDPDIALDQVYRSLREGFARLREGGVPASERGLSYFSADPGFPGGGSREDACGHR